MGSLIIILLISCYIQRKGCTKDSLWQTILTVAFLDGLQVHIIEMQHKDLLLHYEQSLVK